MKNTVRTRHILRLKNELISLKEERINLNQRIKTVEEALKRDYKENMTTKQRLAVRNLKNQSKTPGSQ